MRVCLTFLLVANSLYLLPWRINPSVVGVDAFVTPAALLSKRQNAFQNKDPSYAKKPPEYTIDEDDDDDDDGGDYDGADGYGTIDSNANLSGDYILLDTEPETETNHGDTKAPRQTEYGALSPGTVVQVQVGDISAGRKAWKKRRRSGSPLLVPCSVLNVDRKSMVRWNLIFLLEKFGVGKKDGISISDTELTKRYRTFLQSSLQKQATELGFESKQDMIVALFNKKTQESYGVRLVKEKRNDDESDKIDLSLKAPISRRKAQVRAASTPVLQFRPYRDGDHGDVDTLTHTGYIRSRSSDPDDKDYHFIPLSAAMRVSQKEDVDTGKVVEGGIHPAIVFDYDLVGDAGSPLLTLSLNPRGVRDSLKVKPQRKYTPVENPTYRFNDLSVGDGPFRAKVVSMLPGRALVDFDVGRDASDEGMVKVLGTLMFKDSVDLVQEEAKDPFQDKFDHWARNTRVFAIDDEDDDDDDDEEVSVVDESYGDMYDDFMLADDDDDDVDEEGEEIDDDDDDDDMFVDDLLNLRTEPLEEGTFEEGEEEEDLTNLFHYADDGSLMLNDVETGEIMRIDDEDVDDMLLVKDAMEMFALPSKRDKKRESASSSSTSTASSPSSATAPKPSSPSMQSKMMPAIRPTTSISIDGPNKLTSKWVRVGDEIDVYVRSVGKKSGQLSVSTNPLIQGRNAKELKRESGTEKKLKRLKQSLGGSLDKIWKLQGQECDGVVKAASKTGDWVYVQPGIDELPVGVAIVNQETMSDLAAGDTVRVRISGVDETRGQLAMDVLGKVNP